MGRLLILLGTAFIVVGVLTIVLGRMGLPRLPGDIVIERDDYKVCIPVASAILVSIVLSLIVYYGGRYLR